MIFKSQNNKCTFWGYVNTIPQPSDANKYALEFKVSVPRPTKKGERQFYDVLDVYVSDYKTVQFCKQSLQKGLTIEIKGELRKFKQDQLKICTSDIALKSNR